MSEVENQVRNEVPHPLEDGKTEEKNQVRKVNTKLRTRCYYTDYVNHAIRFFLTTPETLKLDGKRRADIENWMAVQAVFHCLKDEERQLVEAIYRSNYKVTVGVKEYCEKHNTSEQKVWMLITKTTAAIARRRGLI